MGVPGGGVARRDRGGQRRQQHVQPPGHPGQGPRRHLQPLKRQHRDDPVERQAERVLGDQQVHAELSGEQAPADQRGRAGRGHHRRHRAPAAPGVLAPPVHHPPHPDPPGNLLADILPQQLIGPAAPPAAPLAFREVMNLLLGLQMLMPAPGHAPSTPAADRGAGPGPARITRAPISAASRPVPVSFRLTRAVLLTRGAEQHPAQRDHPLPERFNLLPPGFRRPGQRRVLRRQPRCLSLPELRAATPQRRLIGGGPGTRWREHHANTAPPPQPVSSTAATACRISPTGSPNTYRCGAS